MVDVVFVYYPLTCGHAHECEWCGQCYECTWSTCGELPAAIVRKAERVKFTGSDGSGNWKLTIGNKVYDSNNTIMLLLKIDGVIIYKDEEEIKDGEIPQQE